MAFRETSRPSVFWPMAAIVIGFLSLISRQKVLHRDRLPLTGAYIIAPNHYSEIDPVVVGQMVWQSGRQPRFLAKASLFKVPVVGWFLRKSGQIPVYRSGSELAAVAGGSPLAAAKQLVERQQVVVVYPEGSLTRDPDLWPMRGKTGAARIALEQDIPVIPVAHWGTQQIMGRYSKKVSLWPRKTITFNVGEPVDLSAFRGRPIDGAVLTEATEAIMADITRLLEELRGEKAPERRWDPAEQGQKETGRFES